MIRIYKEIGDEADQRKKVILHACTSFVMFAVVFCATCAIGRKVEIKGRLRWSALLKFSHTLFHLVIVGVRRDRERGYDIIQ